MGAGGAAEHGRVALDPPPARGGGRPGDAAARVQYVGRTWRASTSEGYPTLHQYEQDRIVREALGHGRGLTLGARSTAPHERRSDAGAVPARREEELLSLLGRKPSPGLEHDERHRRRLDAPGDVDENRQDERSARGDIVAHDETRSAAPGRGGCASGRFG